MSSTEVDAHAAAAGVLGAGWTHFKLDRRSPSYWRVTFDHPPINTITATTVNELSELVEAIERESQLKVVVFASANPDFFLAHYDVEGDPTKTVAIPPEAILASTS